MTLPSRQETRIAADQLYQIMLIHGCVWHQEWCRLEDIGLDKHPAAVDLINQLKAFIDSQGYEPIPSVADEPPTPDDIITCALDTDEWDPDVNEILTEWHRKHATAILELFQEVSN